MIKIKVNPKLFDKWKYLSMQVGLLNGIVQNDMEIGLNELRRWVGEVDMVKQKFDELAEETANYIDECMNRKDDDGS